MYKVTFTQRPEYTGIYLTVPFAQGVGYTMDDLSLHLPAAIALVKLWKTSPIVIFMKRCPIGWKSNQG